MKITKKPISIILLIVAVLLIATCGFWIFASETLPVWLMVGFWAAALIIAMLPLVISLIDHASKRKP